MEVTFKNAPDTYEYKKGFQSWHTHRIYTCQGHSIAISDSVGGCGMQQLYHWASVSSFDIANAILKNIISTLEGDVGLILCQVGKSFYTLEFVKALEANGFVITTEYANYRHCRKGEYTQRIYTYHVPRKK